MGTKCIGVSIHDLATPFQFVLYCTTFVPADQTPNNREGAKLKSENGVLKFCNEAVSTTVIPDIVNVESVVTRKKIKIEDTPEETEPIPADEVAEKIGEITEETEITVVDQTEGDEQPEEKEKFIIKEGHTVFVEFADGSKEVAHLNDGDVFSLEVGVLICVVKKLLSEMDIIGTGSSAYNKIIKYALGKLDATKKKREEEQKKAKEERAKLASIKQEVRRAENKKREDRIREMTEAYKRAIGEVSKQASAELEESFKGLLDELEKAEKKDE